MIEDIEAIRERGYDLINEADRLDSRLYHRELQTVVDKQLRSGATYILTETTQCVHDINCWIVRWKLDVEQLAASYQEQYLSRRNLPWLLTREEVERLTRYVACRICAPTLDHAEHDTRPTKPPKSPREGWRKVQLRYLMMNPDSPIGRRIELIEGRPIGVLNRLRVTLEDDGLAAEILMTDGSRYTTRDLTESIYYEKAENVGGSLPSDPSGSPHSDPPILWKTS